VAKKWGALISVPPEHPQFRAGLDWLEKGCRENAQAYAYFLHEAVRGLPDEPVQALRKKGVHIFGCAYAAQKFGLPLTDIAIFSGLTVLGDLVRGADVFVSFDLRPGQERWERRDGPVLVLVKSDPRTVAEAAEGVRVAAGLAVGRRFRVILSLRGPGIHVLTEAPEDLVKGEEVTRYLPVYFDADRTVVVEKQPGMDIAFQERFLHSVIVEPMMLDKMENDAGIIINF
jgi:hypothetical protein